MLEFWKPGNTPKQSCEHQRRCPKLYRICEAYNLHASQSIASRSATGQPSTPDRNWWPLADSRHQRAAFVCMVRLFFFVLCCGILCAEHVHSSRPDLGGNSSVQHELLARKGRAPSPHSTHLHGLLPVPVRRSGRADPASVRGIITLDGMLESLGKYGMEPNAPWCRWPFSSDQLLS